MLVSKNTITIFYIATGTYSIFWKHFLDTAHYFMKGVDKHIILLSDTLSEYDNYTEEHISVEYHHIDHYPWPVITLFKMRWMLEYMTESDYIYYFNSNIYFKPNTKTVFNKGNYLYAAFPYFPEWYQINPFNKNIVYVGGWFFGGHRDKVIPMLEYTNKVITERLAVNVINVRHDETVINEYIANEMGYGENLKLVNAHDFLELYRKEDYASFKDRHPYIDTTV